MPHFSPITIHEPATMATDYLLALVSLACGIGLSRRMRLWRIGFFCVVGAAVLGGTFHGFAAYQGVALHQTLWDSTMILIGAAIGFMTSAALSTPLTQNPTVRRWLRAGVLLTLAGLAIQIGRFDPSASFNHNDLYHCLQALAMYFLFRGVGSVH